MLVPLSPCFRSPPAPHTFYRTIHTPTMDHHHLLICACTPCPPWQTQVLTIYVSCHCPAHCACPHCYCHRRFVQHQHLDVSWVLLAFPSERLLPALGDLLMV